METSLSQQELELFLNEYRDILEQTEERINRLSACPPDKNVWNELFVLANNLQGISEFTDVSDLREVTRLFTDGIAALERGTLSFDPLHAEILAETSHALRRIFELIREGNTTSINETDVKAKLAVLSRGDASSDYTESMNGEEAEIFRSELMELTALFSDSVDRIARGEQGEELIFNCFKSTHTLKGFGSMIECTPLHVLARELERIFFAVKEGRASLSPGIVSVCRQAQPLLSSIADDIISREEREYDLSVVLDSIGHILRKVDSDDPPAQMPVSFSLKPLTVSAQAEDEIRELNREGNLAFDVIIKFTGDTEMKKVRAFQILRELQECGRIIAAEPDETTIDSLQDDIPGLKVLYAAESKGETDIRRMVEDIISVESLIVSQKEVA